MPSIDPRTKKGRVCTACGTPLRARRSIHDTELERKPGTNGFAVVHTTDRCDSIRGIKRKHKPPKRPKLVQMALDKLKKRGDYREDVPLEYHNKDFGMEHALIKYVERLEKKVASCL